MRKTQRSHNSTLKPREQPMARGRALASRPVHPRGSRKAKRDTLDTLTRQIVRLRDQACVTCGTTRNLECGHYFTRASWRTRWHLMNCHAQCHHCNGNHESDREPYTQFMRRAYGQEAMDALYRQHENQVPFSDAELDDMIARYTALLETLKGSAPVDGTLLRCACGNEINPTEVSQRERYAGTEDMCEWCFAVLAQRQTKLDTAQFS